MSPEVQELYDRFIQQADNCQADVALHEYRLMMHLAVFGNAFPGMQRLGAILIEQSRALEEEAREMAYLLLKDDACEPPFKKLAPYTPSSVPLSKTEARRAS